MAKKKTIKKGNDTKSNSKNMRDAKGAKGKHVKQIKKAITKISDKDSKNSNHQASFVDNYKTGLVEIDKEEYKYDKLFEQKLAQQYREFRNIKEHHIQFKKFIRVLVVLIVIILIALLLLSFRV